MQDLKSGKTFTLKAIAKTLNTSPSSSLYTAFQKSVIIEGKQKLSSLIECRTLHSLAYKYIYPMFKTEVQDNLEERMLPPQIPFKDRAIAIASVEKFFTSSSITLDFFDYLEEKHKLLAINIVNGIIEGKYPITFNFMLKYLHLCIVDGTIEAPKYKVLMLDEAGDTTGVILELFKLIKADKKIMAGDPQQNIYVFMNTINGFELLKDEGITLNLTKSYRVSSEIAPSIEKFVQAHLDSKMQFKGINLTGSPKNIAYISLTNAALIDRMFHLVEADKNFGLLREAKSIFVYPLAIITASTGKPVYSNRYKFLEEEYIKYQKAKNQEINSPKTFLVHLKIKYPEDIPLQVAINLLFKHSFESIFKLYGIVKNKHLEKTTNIYLSTAHTSKGMTFDSVYIEDDLNNAVLEAETKGDEEAATILRLGYTAATRTRYCIYNCKFLDLPDQPIDPYLF